MIAIAIAPYLGYGQENPVQIKGKIINPKNDVSNILIVNENSKESTISDSLGFFTIAVRLKDSLRFTAVQYRPKKIVVTDSIYAQKTILVKLAENTIQLEEVVVTPYNLTGKLGLDIESLNMEPIISSSTLELPNAGLEIMTQGERLLLEADRGKYVHYYGPALTINTHKIMNKLSGRIGSLERRVATDKKIELQKEIISKFPKETICEGFNIPQKKLEEFLTYCISQTDFLELSKESNTEEIWEYLRTKSIRFNNLTGLYKVPN